MIDVSEAWARSEAHAATTELDAWVPASGFDPSPMDEERPPRGHRTYTAAARNGVEKPEIVLRKDRSAR